MKPLKSFSRKVGFTDTETNVILFIVLAFLIGLGVNLFKDSSGRADYLEFDYKIQDSLFDAALGNYQSEDSLSSHEKRIDSKPELLDFSKANKSRGQTGKKIFKNKLIDINKAPKEELLNLPGIGGKTAENIIDYRNLHGPFTKAEGLMKVKGIGSKKFEKIKNLVTIK